jgi:Carboxypeptidase regulatory-like domain
LRILAALLLIGCSASPVLAQAPARDAPAATGTAVVRGRVTVAGVDRALSRVEVHAVCPPLRVNKAVLTDGNGRYEIAELPAGRYTVAFSRVNYVRANYGQRRPLGPGAPIEIANGQVVTRIDAALQRSSVIAGRVVDEYGDPMTGVQVMPMRYALVNGERRLEQVGFTGLTNDIGEYRIHGLTPGRYFVSAILRRSGYSGAAYAPTYYPGTGSAAEAQRLTIAPGQTIDGVNMTLLPVATVRVSGIALDSRGRPMAGANVNLMQRIGSGTYGSSYGQVRPDGTFRIDGVAPGDYALNVSLAGAPDENAAADITVSSADLTDVQVIAVKPSTLRGLVVLEAGNAKPPAPGTLRVTVAHPGSRSPAGGSDTPKADGSFEIKTRGGHLMLGAGLLGGGDWRLKRVLTADGVEVTDTGFDVPPGAGVDGLVVTLTSRLTEISGTVVDAAGAIVRDCVVVVFAQDPLRWTAQTRFFGIGRPDLDDVFHARVPAGDYYAAAFELDEPNTSLNDPDIFQQLRDRAIRLSVGDGETKSLRLTLGEPPVL